MKIVWAVDPFLSKRRLQVASAWAAKALTRGGAGQVEPVFVLREYPVGVVLSNPPKINHEIQEAAQEELSRLLVRVDLPNLLPLRVITAGAPGQRGACDSLVNHAKQTGASLILLSTHAREGMQRWLMGSFAETLMLHADVPLFIVNPRWQSATDFGHILFATDFSEGSDLAVAPVAELAQALDADVTLFHQTRFAEASVVHPTFSAFPLYMDALEQELKESDERMEALVARFKGFGVRAIPHIDSRAGISTADAILSYAEGKHQIIAMAGRSGRVEAALLGSTTRRVVRGSSYPVWIIHPVAKTHKAAA